MSCIIRAKMTSGHSLHWLQGYISYSLSCSFMSPSDISPNVSLFSFMSLKMAASCSLWTLSTRKGEVGIASPQHALWASTPWSSETWNQTWGILQALLTAGNLPVWDEKGIASGSPSSTLPAIQWYCTSLCGSLYMEMKLTALAPALEFLRAYLCSKFQVNSTCWIL